LSALWGGTYSIGAKKMKIEINEEIFKIIEDSYGTEHANEVLRACNSHYELLERSAELLRRIDLIIEERGNMDECSAEYTGLKQAIQNATK
jgi:hypothetical protein